MQNPAADVGFGRINHLVNSSLPSAIPAASANPLQIIMEIAGLIWAAGIAALLIYSIVSYLKATNNLKTATHVRNNIFETDRITTPFVCGFIKPKIYVPAGIGSNELSYILAHEQTHIDRFDYLIKPLAFLALIVHWFNPLMWLSFALMSNDMEMSCDECVIKKMGSAAKSGYSYSLLSLSVKRSGLILGSPLAFGESNIKPRIKNILNYKKPALWVVVLAVVATVSLLVALTANPKGERGSAQAVYSGYMIETLINCEITDSTGKHDGASYNFTYTREAADKLMGGDVRRYAGSAGALKSLIDRLNDTPFRANTAAQVAVGGQVEQYLETIMSSPRASSNPQDYIKAHEGEYNAILALDAKALPHLFAEFDKGGQTGLKGYIMERLCRTILSGEDIQYQSINPQDWYDHYKAHTQRIVGLNSLKWVRDNYPKGSLVLSETDQ